MLAAASSAMTLPHKGPDEVVLLPHHLLPDQQRLTQVVPAAGFSTWLQLLLTGARSTALFP